MLTRSARIGVLRTDWHQAAVFAMATKDPLDAKLSAQAALIFATGLLMVLMQCVTAVGVFQGILYPSCASNDQCGTPGQFCGMQARLPRGENCWYCGTCARARARARWRLPAPACLPRPPACPGWCLPAPVPESARRIGSDRIG